MFISKLNVEAWHKQGSPALRLQVIVEAVESSLSAKLLQPVVA